MVKFKAHRSIVSKTLAEATRTFTGDGSYLVEDSVVIQWYPDFEIRDKVRSWKWLWRNRILILNINVIPVFLTCDFLGSGLPKKFIGSDFKTSCIF